MEVGAPVGIRLASRGARRITEVSAPVGTSIDCWCEWALLQTLVGRSVGSSVGALVGD
jgi:hypothetical protein